MPPWLIIHHSLYMAHHPPLSIYDSLSPTLYMCINVGAVAPVVQGVLDINASLISMIHMVHWLISIHFIKVYV